MLPLPPALERAASVLVMGCGGGFDVFCGVPLAIALRAAGKRIVFANHSSPGISASGAEGISDGAWRVTPGCAELPVFAEKWLTEWLLRRDWAAPVYALAHTGAAPLSAAIGAIVARETVDAIVLVDGGADSIIFGDEPGIGTLVEDAIALIATHALGKPALVASIGFGVDDHDGVSHHAFLENVAVLTRDRGFEGAWSVLAQTDEGEAYLDLVDYANARQPKHQSIVCNSVASAIRGEFGDYRATRRTTGAVFISPLTSQYWLFDLPAVVSRMIYAKELASATTSADAHAIIERVRQTAPLRTRKSIPL
ncbi:MAG: DUF1152 domain-containing protein [Pseudomonadota bacterium]